jgi:Flp pilus assembly protein TadB
VRRDPVEESALIRNVLRTTWRATLLVTIAISGGAFLLHPTLAYVAGRAVLCLFVAPPFWWWFVGRRSSASLGPGAIAGALIFATVWVLALAISHIAIEAQRPPGWKPSGAGAGLTVVFDLIAWLGGSLLAALAGATCGTLVAWLERLLRNDRNAPPRREIG